MYREMETFVHYWRECKYIHFLWRVIRQSVIRLKMFIFQDLGIPPVGVYDHEALDGKKILLAGFLVCMTALFINKKLNQLSYPL